MAIMAAMMARYFVERSFSAEDAQYSLLNMKAFLSTISEKEGSIHIMGSDTLPQDQLFVHELPCPWHLTQRTEF
jgi:hypothetical protein